MTAYYDEDERQRSRNADFDRQERSDRYYESHLTDAQRAERSARKAAYEEVMREWLAQVHKDAQQGRFETAENAA